MKSLLAPGNGTSVQLSMLERVGTRVDGTLCSTGHLIPSHDLAFNSGMVMVFAWMSDY
jgi:hypothetical protein